MATGMAPRSSTKGIMDMKMMTNHGGSQARKSTIMSSKAMKFGYDEVVY